MPLKILDLSKPSDYNDDTISEARENKEYQAADDANLIVSYHKLYRDKPRFKKALKKAMAMAKETKKRADSAEKEIKELKKLK